MYTFVVSLCVLFNRLSKVVTMEQAKMEFALLGLLSTFIYSFTFLQ